MSESIKDFESAIAELEKVGFLEPLPEAAGYLGFIFSRAGDARVAERALREAYARLIFTIAPAIDARPKMAVRL